MHIHPTSCYIWFATYTQHEYRGWNSQLMWALTLLLSSNNHESGVMLNEHSCVVITHSKRSCWIVALAKHWLTSCNSRQTLILEFQLRQHVATPTTRYNVIGFSPMGLDHTRRESDTPFSATQNHFHGASRRLGGRETRRSLEIYWWQMQTTLVSYVLKC
jgi:hypothetical protein